jgi:hypothetical protein
MVTKARALCAAVVLSLLAPAVVAAELEQPMLDSPAPEFDLPSLGGERVALTDLRGKLLVLHFGAGW